MQGREADRRRQRQTNQPHGLVPPPPPPKTHSNPCPPPPPTPGPSNAALPSTRLGTIPEEARRQTGKRATSPGPSNAKPRRRPVGPTMSSSPVSPSSPSWEVCPVRSVAWLRGLGFRVWRWCRPCRGRRRGGTQKHSEAGYGWPVDRGVWTAKTVKRPRQQPAHPQFANYWAPLTRKRHTMPHPAQPQHANYWAPRTRKRYQQEHRPQRPTESSDPTQHAKGRTGDRPGPRKGATTRRNVTQGGA